jgi:hypothetical protein
MSMAELRLDDALIPHLCWNTHLACMQRLCDAAGRGLDLAAVAGITGLGFRTALCREATPPSLYHTWAWAPQFRAWLDALGLDAEISEHRTYMRSFNAWLERQHASIIATLERGFPVLHWDNLGFGLILGADDDGYWISGIPEQSVNPLWQNQRAAAGLMQRLQVPGSRETPAPFYCPRTELAPVLDDNALFIYTYGVAPFAERQALLEGLYNAWTELSGMLENPRVLDDAECAYTPLYGIGALERWREELRLTKAHAFGVLLNINAIAEGRRYAAQYLARATKLAEESVRPQLEQAVQFIERAAAHWRTAQSLFTPPLRETEQFTRENLVACREALYQVQQTEETALRVLGVVVRKMLADSS